MSGQIVHRLIARMRGPVVQGIALLVIGGWATSHAAEQASEIERGRQLYVSTGCYQCHGFVGQGSRITAPALLPVWPLQAFAAQLRNPSDAMPPYTTKVMSDADVAAIQSYVASLPAPPNPSGIPLLQAAKK
jgi:ubiquinol-cytochrome c reductase cytochrome c subunit